MLDDLEDAVEYVKSLDMIDEDKIAAKLYGENKNAFYRLKNRLLTDLNKSLLLQHSRQGVALIWVKGVFCY